MGRAVGPSHMSMEPGSAGSKVRGNGALTLGATPGLAVARMWLLAAACDVYLAALSASGAASGANPVTPLSAGEIASWRAVGGELLPRLWEHLRSRPGPGEPWPGEVQGQGQPGDHRRPPAPRVMPLDLREEREPHDSGPGPAGQALRQRRATTSAHPTAAAMAKILAGPAATCPSVRCGAR